jgi:hypothetical protein
MYLIIPQVLGDPEEIGQDLIRSDASLLYEGNGTASMQCRHTSGGSGQHVCILTRSAVASPDRSGHHGSLGNTAEAAPLVADECFACPVGWSGAPRDSSRGHAYVAIRTAVSRAL